MQPIIALYFESENELKFYTLEARYHLDLKWAYIALFGNSSPVGLVLLFQLRAM